MVYFLRFALKRRRKRNKLKSFSPHCVSHFLLSWLEELKKINKRSVEEKEEEATLFALSDWMGSFTVKSTTEPARKTVNSQQTNISHQVAWSNNPRSPYHWVSQSNLRRSVYFSWGTTLYCSPRVVYVCRRSTKGHARGVQCSTAAAADYTRKKWRQTDRQVT